MAEDLCQLRTIDLCWGICGNKISLPQLHNPTQATVRLHPDNARLHDQLPNDLMDRDGNKHVFEAVKWQVSKASFYKILRLLVLLWMLRVSQAQVAKLQVLQGIDRLDHTDHGRGCSWEIWSIQTSDSSYSSHIEAARNKCNLQLSYPSTSLDFGQIVEVTHFVKLAKVLVELETSFSHNAGAGSLFRNWARSSHFFFL
jgi:hypothetical protein